MPQTFTDLGIRARLSIGFGFLLLLAAFMAVCAYYGTDAMAALTENLYAHPFTTTNQSLECARLCERIRRLTKDIAIEKDDAKRMALVQEMARCDGEMDACLDLVKESFLGDPRQVTEIRIELERWREWRRETTHLSEVGKNDAAWWRTVEESGTPSKTLLIRIDTLVTASRGYAKTYHKEAQERHERIRLVISAALGAMVVLGVAASFLITRSIGAPLGRLREAVLAIAGGKLDTEVPHREDRNEVGDMARSVAVFKDALLAIERQGRVKEQTAELLSVLQRAEDLEQFAGALLSKLCPLLDGGYGALFVLDEESRRYVRAGCYGEVCLGRKEIVPGEGLGGQAAKDRRLAVVTDIPDGFLQIASGLGEAKPRALVVLPIFLGPRVLAIAEVASFHAPGAPERALLLELAGVVALTLEALQRNIATRALLAKTKRQADELARGEKELKQSNFQSDTALELTRSGYWRIPFDGSGWYFSSQRTVDILGDPPRADMRYRLMEEWFEHVKEGDPKLAEETHHAFEDAVAGRVPSYDATYAYRRPCDGRVIYVHDLGSVVRDGSGKAVEMLGCSQDVTAFKKLEQDLVSAKEAAESATRAKSDFLANMSHEIRTPMNAVIGLAHLALKTQLTAKQRDYLSKIHNAGTSLLGIINDILDFSKIEAGRLDIERTDFDLDQVLNGVSTVVGQKAHDKGLELLVSVAPDVPTALVGDPLRLGQIVTNLVNNAVKFTERGQVRVRVTSQERTGEKVKLRVSIEDTGIGMSREQAARLFKPFTQADASTTRKHGGTGLGLTIAKRLVELMGGQIGLDSEPGVGSTFYFTAWLGIGASEMTRRQRRIVPEELTRLRVLVADDNPAAREILTEALSGVAARVDTVANGAEAVEAVEAEHASAPYDVVFMDWRMPGMDGLEATARIKRSASLARRPRVVMVTAFGREEVREEAEKLAVDGFLLKPVTRSMVVDTLVSIFAPAAGDVRQQAGGAGADEAAHRLDGARILLAEDNAVNQQIAVELLEGAGAQVTVAENGRVALEKLEAAAPGAFHVVLMDMQMPEMDGHQATARIRASERLRGIPIIAMTAHATTEERQRCLDEGMVDHIAKPIDPEALYRAVRKLAPAAGGADSMTIAGRAAEPAPPPAAPPAAAPSPAPPPPRSADALPVLSGLDTRDGLSRVAGNEKLYRKLLLQFAGEQRDAAARVGALLASGDRAGAERAAHTVKGVAGNLGAKEVQAAAGKLEKALGKKGDAGLVEALRAELERLLEALLPPLAAALAPPPAATPAATSTTTTITVDPARARELVASLRKQLSEFDAAAGDAVEANRDALRAVLGAETLGALDKAIQGYSFDEALACLEGK